MAEIALPLVGASTAAARRCPSDDEVARHQRGDGVEGDGEIGEAVAIDVAEYGGVAARGFVAKLAGNACESRCGDEGEGLIAGKQRAGVDVGNVDQVALGMVEIADDVAGLPGRFSTASNSKRSAPWWPHSQSPPAPPASTLLPPRPNSWSKP